MRNFFVFTLFVVLSSSAFAADDGSFFSTIGQVIQDISDFLFIDIPSAVNAFFLNIFEWFIMLKIKGLIWSVEFAFEIAQYLTNELSVTSMLSSALGAIPGNIGYYLNILNIPSNISFLLECYMTRFVMQMVM